MTPVFPNSNVDRRAEPAVQIRVPDGFFERLSACCDFRTITQTAFNRYNPRPTSSKADSTLFFKILLLEFIFDASYDALRNEFESHPGIRRFLNLDSETVLPRTDEVVLFHVKLSWLGFKRLLDSILQEAKKNKLSDADCSILERRYDKPLVITPRTSPNLIEGPFPSLSRHRPASLEPYESILPSARRVETSPDISSLQKPEEKVSIIEAVQSKVFCGESTLQETAEMIWATQSAPEKTERSKPFLDSQTPWPAAVPAAQPEFIGKRPSARESLKETLISARSDLEKKAPVTDEKKSLSTLPEDRTAFPDEEPLSLEPRKSLQENESDPLGIESYFDSLEQPPSEVETSEIEKETEVHDHLPAFQSLIGQSFTISSSGAILELPPFVTSSTILPRVKFGAQPDSSEKVIPAEPSTPAQESKKSEPIQNEASPVVDERLSGPAVELKSSEDDKDSKKPLRFETPMTSRPPRHWTEVAVPMETPRVERNPKPLFSSFGASTSSKGPATTSQFFSRSFYLIVPLIILLGVYLMIVLLKNNHSTTLVAEPSATHSAPNEMLQKQVVVAAPQPGATAAKASSNPISPLPGAEKQEPRNSEAKQTPPVQKKEPEPFTPNQRPNSALNRTKNSSAEAIKKEALILHLKKTFHLDLQPEDYTYEELKDINSRLEKESKKPNDQ